MKFLIAATILFLLTACEVSINKDHIAEGTKLMQQGDYFNAALEFDDALFADNNNLEALRGKYYCALNMGYPDKALAAANKFIELQPDSSIGYHDRGTIFLSTKKYDKALYDFNKAIELGTQHPLIAYFNKAEALRLLNRDQDAIPFYRYVTLNSKNDARAFFRLGQVYKKTGLKDSACISYKIAKELGDEDAKKEYSASCN